MHALNYSSNEEMKKKILIYFSRLQNWTYEILDTEKTENTDMKMTAVFQKNKKIKKRKRPFTDKDYITEKKPALDKIKKITK